MEAAFNSEFILLQVKSIALGSVDSIDSYLLHLM